MTKDELRKELKTGVKLEDIFEFTDGQDCLIYKGKFFPGIMGDDICYIPDIYLNAIPKNRSVFESEIEYVVNECYTTNDFVNECKGHQNLAEDLFNFVDWQHPIIQDFLEGYDDEKQFFEEYGFSINEVLL